LRAFIGFRRAFRAAWRIRMAMMKRFDLWIGIVIGSALITASWRGWTVFGMTEALGFVTGAACVYLVVRQNVWNFPLGIVNNIFFLILFLNAKLYGDAGLQLVYVALGFQGWYYWMHGGQNRRAARISHASPRLLIAAGGFVVIGAGGLVLALRAAGGAAPMMDAFTTVLSLAAQYLLNRKTIENWFLWIVADVIYVWLYISRGLQLTAVLYFVFLCLCVAGFMNWRRSIKAQASDVLKEAAASG
jgi:nicotinamide mononucleotide transporter